MKLLRYLGRHSVFSLMSLLMSILIVAGCLYFYMTFQLPDVKALSDTKLQVPLRIYTADDQLIAEYGAMRRNPVTLDQVPKPLLNALIATEDQRFFEHPGVDFWGVLRAGRELIITGQKNQGASTISMQVARNFFLTPEKTFTRKINEILLALKINSTFSKEKILELYINKIYLGQHAYGVSAAASIYYGKTLDQLTLPEMAMIAGLPQAPSRENPITNPALAKIRRDHVLARMLELKYITQAEYQAAINTPVQTYYHGPKITVEAPHVAEMVRNVIYQQYGDDGYTQGLNVYTTIDSHLQQTANVALRDGLVAYDKRHNGYRGPEKNLGTVPMNLAAWQGELANLPLAEDFTPAAVLQADGSSAQALLADGQRITVSGAGGNRLKVGDVIRVLQKGAQWQLIQVPKVQGAIVSIDPINGAVRALNGGFNESDTGFNRAIQANRQPGSNFKPFIYAAALAKGYTLATIINDAPVAINDTGDPNKLWRPQNDSGDFNGPTRIHMGLVKSLNLVSIRILQMIGVDYAIDYASKFGFDPASLPQSLSLALGTASVTPMQMAASYSIFANGGYRVVPYFIGKIQAADGKVLYQANPPTVVEALAEQQPPAAPNPNAPVAPRVIEADVAYMMNTVMQDVIKSGTGYAARVLQRNDIAGKTGTTNRLIDAWFSGFNPRVETTVWVGYDQPKPLGESGGQAALPIWIDFMRVALNGQPEVTLRQPDNVVATRIDPDTGLLASPEQTNAVFEVFREGTVPTEDAPNAPEDASVPPSNNDGAQLF